MQENTVFLSFCITCKGRLHHLQQTLIPNIELLNSFPQVEIVLLNYNSPDGLDEWIYENFPKEISQGKLSYYKTERPLMFDMSHAKNVAHRLGRGRVLCNCDADNFLTSKYVGMILSRYRYLKYQTFMHQYLGFFGPTLSKWLNLHQHRVFQFRGSSDDLYGRIALEANALKSLSGYNERLKGWGTDDVDLLERARGLGYAVNILELDGSYGWSIQHSNAERVQFQEERNLQKQWDENELIHLETIKAKDYVSNGNSWGVEPILIKNFTESLSLAELIVDPSRGH